MLLPEATRPIARARLRLKYWPATVRAGYIDTIKVSTSEDKFEKTLSLFSAVDRELSDLSRLLGFKDGVFKQPWS